MKLHIKDALQEAEEEKHALEKYKKEVGLLLQEKMAHVEELRLIHTDINCVSGFSVFFCIRILILDLELSFSVVFIELLY